MHFTAETLPPDQMQIFVCDADAHNPFLQSCKFSFCHFEHARRSHVAPRIAE